MEKILKKALESEKETIKFGKSLIKKYLKDVNLIILKGEIGSGKTTLVKGIAESLDIKEDITSPTYGHKKVYDGLVHYDLYLSKKVNSNELQSLISEDLEDNLVIIEWGEKIPKISNCVVIEIDIISDNGRTIEIKRY